MVIEMGRIMRALRAIKIGKKVLDGKVLMKRTENVCGRDSHSYISLKNCSIDLDKSTLIEGNDRFR